MVVFRPGGNIKVCAVSLYSVRNRRYRRLPRSAEDRVSGLERHCPSTSGTTVSLLWLNWSPACGAAFSLDDLQATSRRSSRRRFITAEHLLVRRSSGEHIIIQWATSQRESPVGFRPTQEQLTSGTKYDAAFFPPPHHRVCVRRSGHRSGSCGVDSHWLRLIINKTVF